MADVLCALVRCAYKILIAMFLIFSYTYQVFLYDRKYHGLGVLILVTFPSYSFLKENGEEKMYLTAEDAHRKGINPVYLCLVFRRLYRLSLHIIK